uniref:Uncharacterized protein n=1 Tax=Ditylenchus dipsaci TaxID=166011 RepID=A0A915CRX0_9BILA
MKDADAFRELEFKFGWKVEEMTSDEKFEMLSEIVGVLNRNGLNKDSKLAKDRLCDSETTIACVKAILSSIKACVKTEEEHAIELWIYHYSSETFKYANQIFYCDHSKKNRPGNFQCEANMRIRYGKDLSAPSLALIQTTGVHDHKSLKDNGLSSPIKNSINEKDEPCRGMTARMIQQKLQTEPCVSGLQLPTIKQIQNQKSW